MTDPLDTDLNRHLNELDRVDARSEAEDAKVEEWLADKAKVLEALERIAEEDLTDFLKIAASAIVLRNNPEQYRLRCARALGWFEDGVRQRFEEGAAAAVEKDEQDAASDHAEHLAEQEEARKAGY